MSDPKEIRDILGCTIVALDDANDKIRKLEAEVQRLEHTVNYWKIEAKTDHERWERQMEENARLRSDIKSTENLASNVLRLGNEVRDLTAENARLKAEVERLRKAGDAMYESKIGYYGEQILEDMKHHSGELCRNWNAAKEDKPSV
jgi:predicted RNase H-like nuclease (RuvC/YqgF family)